jgi:hypothetical protein
MSTRKQSRRKGGPNKLEPIDWHEFANDAVLNGNMSTLYRRPDTEDPTAYASAEALVEIEKRSNRSSQGAIPVDSDAPITPTAGTTPAVSTEPTAGTTPTVGTEPTVGTMPAVGAEPTVGITPAVSTEATVGVEPPVVPSSTPTVGQAPTAGPPPTIESTPTVGMEPAEIAEPLQDPDRVAPTMGIGPTVGPAVPNVPAVSITTKPTVGIQQAPGFAPTVGPVRKKVRPLRDVQDALTLAGQILYKVMYGMPDDGRSKSCSKGYRQLAAEAHLDKDTVRDLICEFKEKGIVCQVGTYDPDTRSAKTYEVLSERSILQIWRDAGLSFVTTGRNRPAFCNALGEPLTFIPTVGTDPIGLRQPTVGLTAGRSDSRNPKRPAAD